MVAKRRASSAIAGEKYMRRLFCFVFIVTAPAFCQWRHFGRSTWKPAGFIGIGPAAAVNPLAARLDTGWNLAGGAGVTQGYAGVMLDALFANFGINHSTLTREGARAGTQRFWAVTVDPIVHVNPRGPADFYLTAGAGLYGERIGLRVPAGAAGLAGPYDLVRTGTFHRFGVNGGAGFAMNVDPRSRVKVFIEARFHHMFTRDQGVSFVPISLGIRF
jgi:hypothetical protein